MNVLVTNVGERDLYYNVGTNDSPNFCHCEWEKTDMKMLVKELGCQPGARHVGAAILDRIKGNEDNELARCRYPILKTVLNHMAKTQKLDRVVLIVTDQPSATKREYRDKDSVYTGEVLKLLIKRDFENQVDVQIKKYRKRPSSDISYAFFGDMLPQIAPRKEITTLHASISGGIPALGTSLQWQAIRIYRDRCFLYAVEAPDEQLCRAGVEEGKIQSVSISPFLRDLVIGLVEQSIGRYDYRGALDVLNTFRGVRFWEDRVEVVLRHAEHRLNYSFEEAAKVLEGFSSEPLLEHWYESAQKRDLLALLIECYFIAKQRYQNHEYLDMVSRISTFYENGLRFVAAHILSLPNLMDLENKHIPKALLKKQHVPDLHDSLIKDKDMRSFKLGETECWESNKYTWKKLVNYGISKLEETKWQAEFNKLNTLNGLSQLRNKAEHNFVGVSETDLNWAFSPPRGKGSKKMMNHDLILPTLYSTLAQLILLTGSRLPLISPYEQMNAYLSERLRSST